MQAAAFQAAACIVFYVRTQSRIPAFYWLTIKLRPNALTTCLGLIHAGMFSIFCGHEDIRREKSGFKREKTALDVGAKGVS